MIIGLKVSFLFLIINLETHISFIMANNVRPIFCVCLEAIFQSFWNKV